MEMKVKRVLAAVITLVILLGSTQIFSTYHKVMAGDAAVYEGAAAVQVGKYLYYKKGTENSSGAMLYRKTIAGSSAKKLGRVSGKFFIHGEKIYYVSNKSLYAMKNNGTGKTKLTTKVRNIMAIGLNNIYFRGTEYNNKMYRISLKGKNRKLMVTLGHMGEAVFSGDRIYYVVYSNKNKKLYSMNLDGKNKKQLLQSYKIEDLCQEDGRLYFVYNDSAKLLEDRIEMLTQDEEIKTVIKATAGIEEKDYENIHGNIGLKCVKNGVLYYTMNVSGDELICKCTEDGQRTVIGTMNNLPGIISPNCIWKILIDKNEMCIYISGDDAKSQLFKLNADGSQPELIASYMQIHDFSLVNSKVYFSVSDNENDNYGTYKVK